MNEYISYTCKQCGMAFIIPVDGLRLAQVLGRFISCPLGHRQIEELNRYDDLLRCMEEQHVYKREHRRVKQIK